MNNKKLFRIYKKLYNFFGKQNWWPAKTKLEVIIGAILTQNTAWSNVERAIDNLRDRNLLSLEKLYKTDEDELANLIKPAGYFNVKAKRLRNILEFIQNQYQGKLEKIKKKDTNKLRKQLLDVNGIGPETADSILLYAFDKPIFVIDAYTKRIFSRLKMASLNSTYDELQELFMKNLNKDVSLFNEYHALIVKLGKDYCKKNKPKCNECPVRDEH